MDVVSVVQTYWQAKSRLEEDKRAVKPESTQAKTAFKANQEALMAFMEKNGLTYHTVQVRDGDRTVTFYLEVCEECADGEINDVTLPKILERFFTDNREAIPRMSIPELAAKASEFACRSVLNIGPVKRKLKVTNTEPVGMRMARVLGGL